jgi:hypothetical protein
VLAQNHLRRSALAQKFRSRESARGSALSRESQTANHPRSIRALVARPPIVKAILARARAHVRARAAVSAVNDAMDSSYSPIPIQPGLRGESDDRSAKRGQANRDHPRRAPPTRFPGRHQSDPFGMRLRAKDDMVSLLKSRRLFRSVRLRCPRLLSPARLGF